MKTIAIAAALVAVSLLAPIDAKAQTLRCGNKVVVVGDSKAEVVQRCGQPAQQDTFCEPIPASNTVDATGKTVVNVAQCENVDNWTYNPGSGRFISTLQFRRGKLVSITDGDRAP